MPQESEGTVATKPGERIFLDIATIKKKSINKSNITNPNWLLVVDQYTGMKFSTFHAKKNGIVEPLCEFFQKCLNMGKEAIKNVRLDNAGENKLVQQRSQSVDWKLNINYEFTASNSPQQNSITETGFA